jgi:hypothetical protein
MHTRLFGTPALRVVVVDSKHGDRITNDCLLDLDTVSRAAIRSKTEREKKSTRAASK